MKFSGFPGRLSHFGLINFKQTQSLSHINVRVPTLKLNSTKIYLNYFIHLTNLFNHCQSIHSQTHVFQFYLPIYKIYFAHTYLIDILFIKGGDDWHTDEENIKTNEVVASIGGIDAT